MLAIRSGLAGGFVARAGAILQFGGICGPVLGESAIGILCYSNPRSNAFDGQMVFPGGWQNI
jgi:hypothetical protein